MTYQEAKPRKKMPFFDGVFLVPNTENDLGGVFLYCLTKMDNQILPFGRSWHASESEAKKMCREDHGIHKEDWQTFEGVPDFVSAFSDAVDQSIDNYQSGQKQTERDHESSEGDDGSI